MAATSEQLADIRADIGDTGASFSDAELQRIWERVSGASDEALRHEAACGLAIRQLLANSAKLHDYTVAGDSNKASQVYKQLQALYAMYKPALDSALKTKPPAVKKAKMRRYARDRDEPSKSNQPYLQPDRNFPTDV